jgi:hypothetical protein
MRREDATWSALKPELFCNRWQAISNIMAVTFTINLELFCNIYMADLFFAADRCEGEMEEDVP